MRTLKRTIFVESMAPISPKKDIKGLDGFANMKGESDYT
jgi:hypothetical protein